MKRVIAIAMLAVTCLQTQAQNIVIRIDDMGSSHSANLACIDCWQNGIATSVEVMPNCAWFPEAVRLLKENPGLDVGVHLTLTSEWDNVKWGPLTKNPALCNEQGYFFPRLGANQKFPGQSLTEHDWSLEDIEREFRAQIEMCLRYIPQTSHISGHMGSNRFTPEVADLVRRLSAEYGLPSIDNTDSQAVLGFERIGYDGPHRTLKGKMKCFCYRITHLAKDSFYLFLDHPAYDDCEMAGFYHTGSEDVAADRQGVRDLLCCRKVKRLIAKHSLNIISVKQMINR